MRSLVKKLGAVLAPAVPAALVRRALGGFCPIFMLHRVAPVANAHAQSIGHIEACLAYMRRHRFQPLALAELSDLLVEGRTLPDRPVVFTIDDGFRDHFEHAAPLFARFDTPLTCFVITDFLDGRLWPWDDQIPYVLNRTPRKVFSLALPDGRDYAVDLRAAAPSRVASQLRELVKTLPQDELYAWIAGLYRIAAVEQPVGPPADMAPMSWADARAFAEMGHTIAPHTRTHRILSRLPDAASRAEIAESAGRVAQELGTSASVFAYPTGRTQDFSSREAFFLREAGIRCAVSTTARTALPGDEILALPRFALPNNLEDFAQYLGFIEVAKARLRGKRA